MVLQDAFERAQKFLDEVIRPKHDVEIVICHCGETDEGWSFGYNSRAWLEDGHVVSSLVGNGPVIVPKSGDAPYVGPLFPRK
jgi:hypothetical protein